LFLPANSKGQSRIQNEFEVLKWLGKGAFGDVLKVIMIVLYIEFGEHTCNNIILINIPVLRVWWYCLYLSKALIHQLGVGRRPSLWVWSLCYVETWQDALPLGEV
jgi:hypothetical protein